MWFDIYLTVVVGVAVLQLYRIAERLEHMVDVRDIEARLTLERIDTTLRLMAQDSNYLVNVVYQAREQRR